MLWPWCNVYYSDIISITPQAPESSSYKDHDTIPRRHNRIAPFRRRSHFRSQLVLVVLLVLAFGVIVTVINVYQLRLLQGDPYMKVPPEGRVDTYNKKPIVWVNGKRVGFYDVYDKCMVNNLLPQFGHSNILFWCIYVTSCETHFTVDNLNFIETVNINAFLRITYLNIHMFYAVE